MPEPKGGRQCDRLPAESRSVKTERSGPNHRKRRVRAVEDGYRKEKSGSKTGSFVYFPDGCDMAVQAAKRYVWFIL